MKLTKFLLITAAVLLGFSVAVSSCQGEAKYIGMWQGNPEHLVSVPGANDATITVTLDFSPNAEQRGTGIITLNATIEATQSVTNVMTSLDQAYEANIAATASIIGNYVRADDDDDDVLVTFNPTSMQLNVDPAGVTFSNNILTGVPEPMLDSLSQATAAHWKTALLPAVREVFNRYRKIDDIKVHHGDMMSCELADRDYTFRRVGVPD